MTWKWIVAPSAQQAAVAAEQMGLETGEWKAVLRMRDAEGARMFRADVVYVDPHYVGDVLVEAVEYNVLLCEGVRQMNGVSE